MRDDLLFSFNGIDYISHEDRLQAFQEMRRVIKKGGIMCFSTHNIRNLTALPTFPKLSTNPVKMLRRILKYLHYASRNFHFKGLRNERYAIVNDGACNSRLTTYYIKPEESLKQLADCGFSNSRVYSLESGKEIVDKSEMDRIRDPWLYYLCEVA